MAVISRLTRKQDYGNVIIQNFILPNEWLACDLNIILLLTECEVSANLLYSQIKASDLIGPPKSILDR